MGGITMEPIIHVNYSLFITTYCFLIVYAMPTNTVVSNLYELTFHSNSTEVS